jgi:biotin operon repressor
MLTPNNELPTATIGQLSDMLGSLEDKSTLIADLIETSARTLTAFEVIRTELYGEGRVSHAELLAVLFLLTNDPMKLSDLAAGVQLSRAAVTTLVDRLEEDGTAIRVNDPTDRRRILVSIDALVRTRLIGAFQEARFAQEPTDA